MQAPARASPISASADRLLPGQSGSAWCSVRSPRREAGPQPAELYLLEEDAVRKRRFATLDSLASLLLARWKTSSIPVAKGLGLVELSVGQSQWESRVAREQFENGVEVEIVMKDKDLRIKRGRPSRCSVNSDSWHAIDLPLLCGFCGWPEMPSEIRQRDLLGGDKPVGRRRRAERCVGEIEEGVRRRSRRRCQATFGV